LARHRPELALEPLVESGAWITRLGSRTRTAGWLGWAHVARGGPLVSLSRPRCCGVRSTCSPVHLGVRPFQPRFYSRHGGVVAVVVPACSPRVPEAEGEATGRVQIPFLNLPLPTTGTPSASPPQLSLPHAPVPSPLTLAGQVSPSCSRSLLLLAMCSMN